MCLVQHNPAQGLGGFRFLDDRIVDLPDQHILQHGSVGHQDWGWVTPQFLPRQNLIRTLTLFFSYLGFFLFSVTVV